MADEEKYLLYININISNNINSINIINNNPIIVDEKEQFYMISGINNINKTIQFINNNKLFSLNSEYEFINTKFK